MTCDYQSQTGDCIVDYKLRIIDGLFSNKETTSAAQFPFKLAWRGGKKEKKEAKDELNKAPRAMETKTEF